MSVDLFKFVDNNSLHMPLPVLSMTSTPVECGEGSVFVIPPSKKESIVDSIRQGPTTSVCSLRFKLRLRTPTIFLLRTVSTPYDTKNGIQFAPWERFELRKRTTWSSTEFRAKTEDDKLL